MKNTNKKTRQKKFEKNIRDIDRIQQIKNGAHVVKEMVAPNVKGKLNTIWLPIIIQFNNIIHPS